MQPNESLRSNSTPDARYEVSPEAKQWAEETFATLHSGDVSLGYDEWLRLDRERQHKMEGDSECKLAWLRRESPGGSSEIEDLEEELLRERKKKAADEIERQQEKMESKIPKNLLTHYEDTLRAMSYLEGEGWLLGEKAEGQTAASALKAIESWSKGKTGEGAPVSLFTIYGAHGFNRYFVYSDGSVLFSAGHASKKDTERASRLGFGISGTR
ncbi:MAG: hypothetical protein AAB391_00110 [Patescibacteria group bacterium]